MRSSEFHVEIAGVKYRLAEDAESEHYVHTREKTRPPNSQIVQGTSGGRFNSRPDLMVWSWTDWSDGEGQLKFDETQPARARILEGVNFYARPGNLFLGHKAIETQDSSGVADFAVRSGVVEAFGEIIAVGIGAGNDDLYIWDGSKWGAAVSLNPVRVDGARREACVVADANAIYFNLHGTDEIYKIIDAAGTNTLLNDQLSGNVGRQMTELGDYLYILDGTGVVYEISKTTVNTTTPETPVFDFSSSVSSVNTVGTKIVAGDNRVYCGVNISDTESVIYEIVPTSAAGTGFGREMARIPGLRIENVWWHGGFLWWTGVDVAESGATGASRAVYYYQPGGSWGTIGEVRSYEYGQAIGGDRVAVQAVRLHTAGMVLPPTHNDQTADQGQIGLWEIDAVNGAMGQTGKAPSTLVADEAKSQWMTFVDKYFMAGVTDASANARIVAWDTQTVADSGMAISPDNDFGIATWKILHSIEIQTEPLPANTSVTVSYKLDDGSWNALSAHDTDNSGGTKWTISTGGSTKTFRYMAVKVELAGTGGATPVLKGVDVRASVDEYVNLWHLLLDCTDESSPRGYSGSTLVDHITSLSDTTMFVFYDGYEQREFSVDLNYNVVVDNMAILLTKPGEGYVQVTLREVF